MQLLTTQTADRNLFAGATVLSTTVSTLRLCYALILLGDGTKNLTGAGGTFTVTVTVAGRALRGGNETFAVGTSVQAALQTTPFLVPAGSTVTISLTSPNSGDTSVNCVCHLVADVDAEIRAKTDNLPPDPADACDIASLFVSISNSLSMTVLPGRDRQVPASLRGQIAVYLGELITISRRVEDASGNGIDLSGKTLQFVIQDARGTDIAVIGNGGTGSITVSGTNNDTYSFTVPTAGSAKVGNYEYSLNDVGSPNALLASGDWLVQRRAVKDS